MSSKRERTIDDYFVNQGSSKSKEEVDPHHNDGVEPEAKKKKLQDEGSEIGSASEGECTYDTDDGEKKKQQEERSEKDHVGLPEKDPDDTHTVDTEVTEPKEKEDQEDGASEIHNMTEYTLLDDQIDTTEPNEKEDQEEIDNVPEYALAETDDEEDMQSIEPEQTASSSTPTDTGSLQEKKAVGPPDISCYPRDKPQQPNLAYPKNTKGRAFMALWFKDFPWLEYSVKRDSAFCFACRHFAPPNLPPDEAFTVKGFKSWKKAKEKKKGFGAHSNSSCHKQAMISWNDYQQMRKRDTSVSQMANNAYRKEVRENREYIKTVADVLLLTAKQNLAQRGHREQTSSDPDRTDSQNKGNFIEILTLLGKNNPVICHKLVEVPKNAKYTSPKLQNEIIGVLANMVRKEIIDEIKETGEFSIMADETKDVTKTEQISLVLRYYYKNSVKERFILFRAAEKLDAKSLSETLITCLESFGLNYKDNLVGQGYDGAAVMSGKHKGVAKRIQDDAKFAHYVHCHAHRLNLAIVDTTKSVKEAADFFALLEKMYVFISRSYVHSRFINIQHSLYPKEAPRELPRLSDTRWACRYIAVRNVKDRLKAIIQVLSEISEEDNAERAIDARGILSQINFSFIVLLTMFYKLLKESKGLSDMLQKSNVDLANATDIIDVFKIELQNLRSQEDKFEAIWKSASDLASDCKVPVSDDEQPRRRRQRRLPAALQDSIITESIPSQNPTCSTKDELRTQVFYATLDVVIAEVDRRFSSENCAIMSGIQSLNPCSETFLELKSVESFGKIFDANMDDLSHEVPQAKRLIERKFANSGKDPPKTLLQFTSFIDPYQDVFSALFRLCKIACAIPVSSAACERSFSCLKLVKTYLRNTMSNARLSDLGVLHIERELTESLDLDEFIEVFTEQHKNLRINLF